MHHHGQQQPEGVNHDMAFASFHLLASVIATWAPFSVVFTLWLSIIAAEGVGSLPSNSRTLGRKVSRYHGYVPKRRLVANGESIPTLYPLHLIVDNYGTQSQARVKAWQEKHQRFSLHFTPTSSSWLNLVERWSRKLTEKRVRRGNFESVPDLIAATEGYLASSNTDRKPFVWHASARAILDKIARCRAVCETLH